MTQKVLGFVGLGRMGGPMSERLIDAGHSLVAFDKNAAALEAAAARGARVATSPADVADQADIVLLSLPMPAIVEQVSLGADGVRAGSRAKVLIDLSTTGPGVATRVAAGLAERGIQWVDSPVSGGIAGAMGGTLAVMVSCPTPTFEAIAPILRTFGKLFHVGEKAGLAQVAKLGNNLLAASALVVTSEALAMGVKAGINPRVMIDIINASSGRNSATQDKFPKSVLTGTFDFGFATGLSYKDVRLCVDEAESLGVPMIVGAAVREMLAVTQAKYGADSDFTVVAKLLEEWAGVEIRG